MEIVANAWNPEIVEILGIFRRASNATLLADTAGGEKVIYKPTSGQRQLWDFDSETLAAREWLTYEVSEALGVGVVPPTVLGGGPMGPGSIQRYVEPDLEVDLVAMVNDAVDMLWPIAVLDIVTNNADRKLGHLLPDHNGKVWAIDHGLTFHGDEKHRTVLWGLAGLAIPVELVPGLTKLEEALAGDLGAAIAVHLNTRELEACRDRVKGLQANGVHPPPPDDRPALPWPVT